MSRSKHKIPMNKKMFFKSKKGKEKEQERKGVDARTHTEGEEKKKALLLQLWVLCCIQQH